MLSDSYNTQWFFSPNSVGNIQRHDVNPMIFFEVLSSRDMWVQAKKLNADKLTEHCVVVLESSGLMQDALHVLCSCCLQIPCSRLHAVKGAQVVHVHGASVVVHA